MQPYFLPYIGYFQLANSVDAFVIYDNIKYTKKGWINRNRYLAEGKEKLLTLPLQKAPDNSHICERQISAEFDRDKALRTIQAGYHRAPFKDQTIEVLKNIYSFDDANLFNFIRHSLGILFKNLGITTPLFTSSEIDTDHTLKSEQRVIAICKALNASHYINPPGGVSLYDPASFAEAGITLQFLQPRLAPYAQQGTTDFIPALSIVDVLMQNGLSGTISEHLSPLALISPETGKSDNVSVE